MEIYAVDALSAEAVDISCSLLPFIPESKLAKLDRYRNRADYQRSLIGEALVRALICQGLGFENAKICFCQNEFGKPFLKDIEGFHFNLSHSGKWVVCAVDSDMVGIDIEEMKQIDLSIARNYFSGNEYRDLTQLDEEKRLSYFFDLWTLKESYIKAVGKGLSLPLGSFSVKPAPESTFYVDNDTRYLLKMYPIDAGYKLAVCGTGKAFPESITHMYPQNLLKLLE